MRKARRLVRIRAPHEGVCYLTPKPGAPPFVEVGDTVTPTWQGVLDKVPTRVVAVVECSKLYSDVDHEGPPGVVMRICVQNGQKVRTDQVIMTISVDRDAQAPPKPTREEILHRLDAAKALLEDGLAKPQEKN